MSLNTENIVEIKSFDDFNLSEDLLRGIYAYGWEQPSYVQKTGILPVIQGNDSIIQAQSGTGNITLNIVRHFINLGLIIIFNFFYFSHILISHN